MQQKILTIIGPTAIGKTTIVTNIPSIFTKVTMDKLNLPLIRETSWFTENLLVPLFKRGIQGVIKI